MRLVCGWRPACSPAECSPRHLQRTMLPSGLRAGLLCRSFAVRHVRERGATAVIGVAMSCSSSCESMNASVSGELEHFQMLRLLSGTIPARNAEQGVVPTRVLQCRTWKKHISGRMRWTRRHTCRGCATCVLSLQWTRVKRASCLPVNLAVLAGPAAVGHGAGSVFPTTRLVRGR